MATVVLIIGSFIVGLVIVQAGAAVYSSVGHALLRRSAEALSLQLFSERIELARFARRRNVSEAAWDGFRKFVVAKKVVEAESICSFYLKSHDNKPIPTFHPGQFLTFKLRVPGVEKPVVRCYSLSDAPHRDFYRVTIKKIPPPPADPTLPPGIGSTYFHDNIHEGDIIDVRAPGGKFYLDMEDRRPVVFLAGGVGITPFISMMSALVDVNSDREAWLFYGVRHGSEPVKRDYLRSLRDEHPNLHVVFCYSDPHDHEMEGRDFDVRGRISKEVLQESLGTNNYLFYMCGPPGMMEGMQKSLKSWGVPESDIITESFGPASVPKPPKPQAATVAACRVQFAKSNQSFDWDASCSNLLEFAEAKGVDLPFSCRAGSCGQCELAIKSGQVSYPEEPSYELADGCCLTCIGHPSGDVTLDA